MKRVEGTVLLVQEGRFVLQTETGACQIFTVSRRAALEPQQLQALQRAQARVAVGYTDDQQGMSAIAHFVCAAEDRVALAAEQPEQLSVTRLDASRILPSRSISLPSQSASVSL